MTGLERNSDLVEMACYAPLFVNVHAREWTPDLIAFDSGRSFGIPSYWVQKLFSEHSGERILNSSLSNDAAVAASAMCKGERARVPHEVHPVLVLEQRLWAGANCSTLVLKLVNLLPGQLNLTVSIAPQPSRRAVAAKVSVLTGGLDDQNSFAEPFKVAPRESVVELELEPQSAGGPAGFMLQLPGNSLTVALLEGAAQQQ